MYKIDICVGRKLRERRLELALSQENLGKAIGVSCQQIQKYEKGKNSMTATRLCEFAKLLRVTVSYFFDETERDAIKDKVKTAIAEEQEGYASPREILEVMKAFKSIKSSLLRKR